MPFQIKVLIVDDSVLVRTAVRDMLSRNFKQIHFLEDADNGWTALERIMKWRPDLVILDVEMPRMDGLTLLKELQRRRIRPSILMLSVLTQKGARISLEALESGALDFIPKPGPGSGLTLQDIEDLLVSRVNGIFQVIRDLTDLNPGHLPVAPAKRSYSSNHYEVLFLGSSTGGPIALQQIFEKMPGNFPVPIVVVQHMPPVFTHAFAERLNRISKLEIHEAQDGDIPAPGTVFIAPGNRHMTIEKKGNQPVIHLNDDLPRHAHRPSIDVTLESLIQSFGGHVAAVIMTGMGWDGAAGMKALYDAGGLTIAQDEQSSVVFGMNRRAIELGAIMRIEHLKNMVEVLMSYFKS